MTLCGEHGTLDYCGECVYGPEIERLTAERDAAQAEAREVAEQHQRLVARYGELLRQLNEWRAEAGELREKLARVRELRASLRPDDRMPNYQREWMEGMLVSVDVSTGEHDAGNRYFGTVTEVMDDGEGKYGVILLVQDAEPNFTAEPAAEQPAPETFVGVTESGHYSYHDCAKSSRHGWMQCTACRSPITSGEYRTREHADRYATWHRDCCPDDPHWRERDAMSQTAAERIEDYNERGQEGQGDA